MLLAIDSTQPTTRHCVTSVDSGCWSAGAACKPRRATMTMRGMDADEDVQALLLDVVEGLFDAHGLSTVRHNGWVVPGGQLPAVRATLYPPAPQSTVAQVDFEVLVNPETLIVESFGGAGATQREMAGSAINAFCSNTFHVLLDAFWPDTGCDHQHAEQERWSIQGQDWRVTIGTFMVKTFGDTHTVEVPPAAFERLQEQVCHRSLSQGPHWVRLYFFRMEGQDPTVEVLLDNEPFPEAEEALAKVSWPETGAYSVRTFLVLQPGE